MNASHSFKNIKVPEGLRKILSLRDADFERFSQTLVSWAEEGNLRRFPWRVQVNPYKVLLTEVMLRRTRAANVVPVYEKFFLKLPTLEEFVAGSPEKVAQLVYPLGLAWRLQNFLDLQNALRTNQFVPVSYVDLVALPGIGDYVASATRCFAYGIAEPLIDSNLLRLTSRYFGLLTNPESRRNPAFRLLARKLLPERSFKLYNYATLDLPASVCRPTSPRCECCPLAGTCHYKLYSSGG